VETRMREGRELDGKWRPQTGRLVQVSSYIWR
jgi:hypothetical protein